MRKLPQLFENNRNWATRIQAANPDFFKSLVAQQSPGYLWIGCADSRVPANEIVGLPPGELFVHRNVANLVIHTDMNCLSVLQYAVEFLKIEHVIVCGHYGCGGVIASIEERPHGLVDNWLRHIRDIYQRNQDALGQIKDRKQMLDRLCELNVIEQVINLANTTIVQDAWNRGQPVTVHGWIYDISDGLLRDLNVCLQSLQELQAIQNQA